MSSFIAVGAGFAKSLYNTFALERGIVQFQTASGHTIVQFDTSIDEDYNTSVEITDFPVESGSIINDHVVIKPFEFNLTGVISDTPIHDVTSLVTEGITSIVSGLLGPLGTVAAGAGYAAYQTLADTVSASFANYVQLRAMAISNIQPFTVVTKLGTYRNMLIKSISTPRDNKTGDALIFHIALKQVTIVTAQTVNVSVLSDPQVSSGETDAGTQQTSPVADTFTPGRVAGNALIGK